MVASLNRFLQDSTNDEDSRWRRQRNLKANDAHLGRNVTPRCSLAKTRPHAPGARLRGSVVLLRILNLSLRCDAEVLEDTESDHEEHSRKE